MEKNSSVKEVNTVFHKTRKYHRDECPRGPLKPFHAKIKYGQWNELSSNQYILLHRLNPKFMDCST